MALLLAKIAAMPDAETEMMTEANGSITDHTARCMTCGRIGSVSLQPDGSRHVFHCRTCGHVVPCADYNARSEAVRAYCTPGWDDDNIGKPVPAVGSYAPRAFVEGCLTCLGTVTAIVWQSHQPHGGLLVHDHGHCERCGQVALVSPPYEDAARFRAFAEDGSRIDPHRQRKLALLLQHPDDSPEFAGMLPYLIHPPSRMSSTSNWIKFRDKTLRPLLLDRPDDLFLALFLRQVEEILAFRASVAEEDRFWKPDDTAKTA